MDFGLIAAIIILFVTLLIVLILKKREKNKYIKDIERYSQIVDIEKEAIRLRQKLDKEVESIKKELSEKARDSEKAIVIQQDKLKSLQDEYSKKRTLLITLSEKLAQVSDDASMVEFGIYKPRFDYHDSVAFQEAIKRNKEQQKVLVRQDIACQSNTNWQINGSKSEGQKMVKRYIKLLLRAFNSECDAAIAKIKSGNVEQLQKRIESAFEALNKFGESMSIRINYDYRNLRLKELFLCHEKELKLQNERDILREERELQKEEEKAQREYEKAIKEEQKAELDFQKAMEKARKELADANEEETARIQARLIELEGKLEESKALSERAKSQAQLTRSGHVYVISNIGAFGEDVYKIGLTRRLEPEDRVNELGSASVPFKFDIHALIYSEDAPTLETSLQKAFSDYRINMVNNRKEFFKVPLSSIENKVRELGFYVSFEEYARAPEYRETLAILAESNQLEMTANKIDSKIEEEFPAMMP